MCTSKNSAKLKQYYYFHAEFLEEIRYVSSLIIGGPRPPSEILGGGGGGCSGGSNTPLCSWPSHA